MWLGNNYVKHEGGVSFVQQCLAPVWVLGCLEGDGFEGIWKGYLIPPNPSCLISPNRMNLEGQGSSTHIKKKKKIVNLYLFLVWGEPWFESHSFTYNNWISKKCRNCQFIWPYLSHLLHVLNFWNIWTKYLIFKISKQRGGISIFLKKPKQGEGVTIPPFLSSPSLVTLYSLLLPNIQTYCKIGSFFFVPSMWLKVVCKWV